MRERARLLGGHLRIASHPESGTVVSASVPASEEAGT
jgi:signal transduction histidine kinase